MNRPSSIILVIVGILFWPFSGCNKDDHNSGPVPVIDYHLVHTYPHDTNSFTEGFLYHNDSLFESSGSPPFLPLARSVFGPVDLSDGQIRIRVELDKEEYFGEGITYLDGKFYQLTYKNRIGFIYDAVNYEQLGQFSFLSDQGWGLTTDGESLIMSDGSDQLIHIDPQTFLVWKVLSVTEKGSSISLLNELEYIQGYIFANIWQSNTIVKIDPSSGKVTGMIDLTQLTDEARSIYPGSRELNGIAWDPISGNIWITGKCWPVIFEIVLAE